MFGADKPLVASITVAWNGACTLSRHVEGLKAQTVPLQEIIVVDNASTDETVSLLRRDFPFVTILPLSKNLGVGGGSAAGLEYALKKNYEWFWLFDQDSVADASALEKLLIALTVNPEEAEEIGVLASLLVDPQHGFEHVGHIWRGRFVRVPPEQARSPVVFVDTVMASGSLIRRGALEHVGLPRADFFMDWVDNEFNLRLRHEGFKIAQVRASKVHHRLGEPRRVISFFTRKTGIRIEEPAWRRYFIVRNETVVCWHLYGSTKSRLLLLIRLLRQTASNMWHEQNRLQTLRVAWAGFWDGYAKDLSKSSPSEALSRTLSGRSLAKTEGARGE
jgi:GT2 family glycosyltransferase